MTGTSDSSARKRWLYEEIDDDHSQRNRKGMRLCKCSLCMYGRRDVMSAQVLGVPPVGVETVLFLEMDALSTVNRITKTSNNSSPEEMVITRS